MCEEAPPCGQHDRSSKLVRTVARQTQRRLGRCQAHVDIGRKFPGYFRFTQQRGIKQMCGFDDRLLHVNWA